MHVHMHSTNHRHTDTDTQTQTHAHTRAQGSEPPAESRHNEKEPLRRAGQALQEYQHALVLPGKGGRPLRGRRRLLRRWAHQPDDTALHPGRLRGKDERSTERYNTHKLTHTHTHTHTHARTHTSQHTYKRAHTHTNRHRVRSSTNLSAPACPPAS